MIPISPEFESHLQVEVTTHCFAWIIRRHDGVILGFTDHDQKLVLKEVHCDPLSGLNSSEASSTLGLSAGGSEIEGALFSGKVTEADIENGFYDGAVVETYLVNWQQPEQHMLLRSWTVGKITRSGTAFVMELVGAAAAFNAVKGRRVHRDCDAQLGDKHCCVSLNDARYAAAGQVEQVVGSQLTVTGLSNFASDWFSHGILTWQTGENKGRSARMAAHRTNQLQLQEQPVMPCKSGDRFKVVAGCDRTYATCKAKFNNGLNFRGFPHLPGNDAAYAYVGGNTEYDGGALVP